jgi:hypothetical protein
MRGGGNELNSNQPDTTDPVGPKFRRGVDVVEQQYDDRWPARGQANIRAREYPPLDDVSRQGTVTRYLKYERGPSISRPARLPSSAEIIGERELRRRR